MHRFYIECTFKTFFIIVKKERHFLANILCTQQKSQTFNYVQMKQIRTQIFGSISENAQQC
jgi:hypothetical protein